VFTTYYIDFGVSTHLSHVIGLMTMEKSHQFNIYMGENFIRKTIKKGILNINVTRREHICGSFIHKHLACVWVAKKLLFIAKPTLLNHVEFGNKRCVITNNHKKVVAFGVKKFVFMNYKVTPMFILLCLDK
jgi:hypothetical protein